MDGSWTIHVQKRDGRAERFDAQKLAGAIWRGMRGAQRSYRNARDLAAAIEIYLVRTHVRCISSAALFEMSVKVLRRVGLGATADAAEAHHARRRKLRRRLRVRHDGGEVTLWDKSWLVALACCGWNVSQATARILAGHIEDELLTDAPRALARREVLDLLNVRVAQWGLAEAVPVDLLSTATS